MCTSIDFGARGNSGHIIQGIIFIELQNLSNDQILCTNMEGLI